MFHIAKSDLAQAKQKKTGSDPHLMYCLCIFSGRLCCVAQAALRLWVQVILLSSIPCSRTHRHSPWHLALELASLRI